MSSNHTIIWAMRVEMASGVVPPLQNQIRRILALPNSRLFQQPRLQADIQPPKIEVCFAPNSGHSIADTDFKSETPSCRLRRASGGNARRGPIVLLGVLGAVPDRDGRCTSVSWRWRVDFGGIGDHRRTVSYDPKPTFGLVGQDLPPAVNFGFNRDRVSYVWYSGRRGS